MSLVRKRSVAIRGHRTSISLEQPFFDDLEEMARRRAISFADLVAEVDASRPREASLSSALRLQVLAWAKQGQRD